MTKRRARSLFGITVGASLLAAGAGSTAAAPRDVAAPAAPATTPHAATHTNPFADARIYGDPKFARTLETLAARTPAHAAALRKMATFPAAIWVESVAGAKEVSGWLEAARRAQGTSAKPLVPTFVIYDLPNRDCAAEASNGELAVDKGGEARYRAEFIDVIAAQFAARPEQRIAVILEPDSLANLVTNLDQPKCAASKDVYMRSVAYAIAKLSLRNVYIYLDAAHGGWLGWGNNRPRAAAIFKDVLTAAGGAERIRGFALNVSNYNPARDPKGRRDNPANEPPPDETTWASDLSEALARVGITGKGFVIDTARNGRNGIRTAPGNWCNIKGAGLGPRPRVAPAPLIDAYLWIKTPGESDGTSDPKAPRFDPNCASDDAAPGAPQAGELFAPYLIELVQNATPPLL